MTAHAIDLIEPTETAETPVIEFVAPMPGFPALRRFVLVRMDEVGLLYKLTSVEVPDVRFLVAPPAPFFPEYAVDVDDESLEALGSSSADDLLLLLVINAGDKPGEATANLLAPIIVSQSTRRAVQLVLNKTGLPVRAPLLAG